MDSTLKRTWAEIDLDALAHNYKTLRDRIGADVKFLGVVKADAYGHGSVQVSRLLQELGADYLAVSSIDEAIELRLNDITMPILILGHTPKEQVSRLIEYNITQAVTCKAKALEYSEEAVKCGGTLKIHIKVDTGMSRLGYLCDGDYFDTGVEGICEGCSLPGLYAEGIFTHFAVSDEPGDACKAYTEHQFQLFTDVIKSVEEKLGRRFAIRRKWRLIWRCPGISNRPAPRVCAALTQTPWARAAPAAMRSLLPCGASRRRNWRSICSGSGIRRPRTGRCAFRCFWI